jgi:hypothetical protein
MGPEAGLAWAEERRMSACFLIPGEDGEIRMAATAAFSRLLDVPGGASE